MRPASRRRAPRAPLAAAPAPRPAAPPCTLDRATARRCIPSIEKDIRLKYADKSVEDAATDCDNTYKDKASCDKDDACSWCTAGAVPPACRTLDEAKQLPPAVFQCDKI